MTNTILLLTLLKLNLHLAKPIFTLLNLVDVMLILSLRCLQVHTSHAELTVPVGQVGLDRFEFVA